MGQEERQRDSVVANLEQTPRRRRPLALRLRNFRPDAGSYLASLGGPLPYMRRLREIERLTLGHEVRLREEYERLAVASTPAELAETWRVAAESWRFDEVNDLICSHNRWFPVEARLPMDPRRGDYALVNGRDYRRRRLDSSWVLARFPATS